MNNLLSYCGLVEVRISASEKDLPAHFSSVQSYRIKIIESAMTMKGKLDTKSLL
jgi:hypothetical protein